MFLKPCILFNSTALSTSNSQSTTPSSRSYHREWNTFPTNEFLFPTKCTPAPMPMIINSSSPDPILATHLQIHAPMLLSPLLPSTSNPIMGAVPSILYRPFFYPLLITLLIYYHLLFIGRLLFSTFCTALDWSFAIVSKINAWKLSGLNFQFWRKIEKSWRQIHKNISRCKLLRLWKIVFFLIKNKRAPKNESRNEKLRKGENKEVKYL